MLRENFADCSRADSHHGKQSRKKSTSDYPVPPPPPADNLSDVTQLQTGATASSDDGRSHSRRRTPSAEVQAVHSPSSQRHTRSPQRYGSHSSRRRTPSAEVQAESRHTPLSSAGNSSSGLCHFVGGDDLQLCTSYSSGCHHHL